ncbi:MAG: murein biosynthesis integral membrane protein MurJ [Treponemataceae bacterium]|nr:MAG: murein biosynthesis integral membrane protein MurJ [Treponemataceae bacterium]
MASIASKGVRLSLLTLASRILGLLREMTKASFLGTSALADAFSVAFMIPNLFRRLFAENSISVAFIPTFKAALESGDRNGDRNKAQELVSAVFTVVSFLTAVFVMLGIAFSGFIVPIFFTSHNTQTEIEAAQTLGEAVFLTRIMFPYLFFISIAAFFQGILNSVKIFSPSAFTPILLNIMIIASAYLLSGVCANPARAFSFGVLAGGFVQAVFQLPFVLKTGFKPAVMPLIAAFKNPELKKVLLLVAPTIVGMAAYQLNDIVSTALAGRSGQGIVSSLQYSLRLQELFLGVFAVSIGTVILPDLAGFAKKELWNEFNDMLLVSIKIIALITIPVTFFALLTGENIIILVYKSNRFTDESVSLTLRAFLFHITGLFFIALNRIIPQAFYARSNTALPTIAGLAGFAANIVLALILVRSMQGGGIALALSLAGFVNTALLLFFLAKTDTSGGTQKNTKAAASRIASQTLLYAAKLIVFSLAVSAVLFFVKDEIFTFSQKALALLPIHNRFLSQGFPLLLCAILYGTLEILLLVLTRDKIIMLAAKKLLRKK